MDLQAANVLHAKSSRAARFTTLLCFALAAILLVTSLVSLSQAHTGQPSGEPPTSHPVLLSALS